MAGIFSDIKVPTITVGSAESYAPLPSEGLNQLQNMLGNYITQKQTGRATELGLGLNEATNLAKLNKDLSAYDSLIAKAQGYKDPAERLAALGQVQTARAATGTGLEANQLFDIGKQADQFAQEGKVDDINKLFQGIDPTKFSNTSPQTINSLMGAINKARGVVGTTAANQLNLGITQLGLSPSV